MVRLPSRAIDGEETVPCLRLSVARGAAPLEAGRVALTDALEAADVGARALYRCELAYEEMVTNALRHGAPGDGAVVDIRVGLADGEVVMVFEDEGLAFDPTAHPTPTRPGSIEEAPIGGLGIELVRRSASRFDYVRDGGRNRVTVAIALA